MPLLPPKELNNKDVPTEPLATQLAHAPHPASVVCLSELLAARPAHPVDCIGTALARLSPTCRTLWTTPWICDNLAAASAGNAEASATVRCCSAVLDCASLLSCMSLFPCGSNLDLEYFSLLMQLHAWLERMAFCKIPRTQEQELTDGVKKPLHEVPSPDVHSVLWLHIT